MKGLGAEESAAYLAALAAIKSSCRLYDIHVHPYEVLFDRFSYQEDPGAPGVLSAAGRSYNAPASGPVRFSEAADFNSEPRSERLRDISVMLLGKIYGSVGARVFEDQMEASRMDQVLLLPIASDSCDAAGFEARMQWVQSVYGDRERFWIAGSIPASVTGADIHQYAALLTEKYGIKAIKVHPVVTGIDLGQGDRRAWLEELLRSCGRLAIPLILHGGRNNPYWGGSRGNFGSLAHLKEIDYSLCSEPVVLAHAGMHRCALREMAEEGLPLLKAMLERHPNLYVDISGLGFEQLKVVLGGVQPERILFGSDALYSPQWEVVTTTMHALKSLGMKWEESFLQFASSNPAQTIFRGDSHARTHTDPLQSVPGRDTREITSGSAAEGAASLSGTAPGGGALLQ